MAELSDQELEKYCEEKIRIFFSEMPPEDQSKMVLCLIAIIRSYLGHTKYAAQLRSRLESSEALHKCMMARMALSGKSDGTVAVRPIEESIKVIIDRTKTSVAYDLQIYVPDFVVELRLHKREVGKKYRRWFVDLEDAGVQRTVFTYLFATVRSLSIKPKKDGFFASYASMLEVVFREILDEANPKGYFVDGKQLQNEYNKTVRAIRNEAYSIHHLPDFNMVANHAKLKRIPRN